MADKIQRIQNNLKSGKSMPLLNDEDILYITKPLGKAIYKNAISKPLGRPRKEEHDKAKPNDRLICNVCGMKFIRSARSGHKKTKVHQIYENMSRKLNRTFLDIDSEEIDQENR